MENPNQYGGKKEIEIQCDGSMETLNQDAKEDTGETRQELLASCDNVGKEKVMAKDGRVVVAETKMKHGAADDNPKQTKQHKADLPKCEPIGGPYASSLKQRGKQETKQHKGVLPRCEPIGGPYASYLKEKGKQETKQYKGAYALPRCEPIGGPYASYLKEKGKDVEGASGMDASMKANKVQDPDIKVHGHEQTCPIPANAKGKEVVVDDGRAEDTSRTEAPNYSKGEDNPCKDFCGICLSETKKEKGALDCCNHIFCYECIMTWARKETTCPLCKQRFDTITVSKESDSKISTTFPVEKTSFRLPKRSQVDDPQLDEISSLFQVAITKPEPKTLGLNIHEAVGSRKHLGEKVKIRVELVCGRCEAVFAQRMLDVKVGEILRLPLNDWPWEGQDCSCRTDSDDTEFSSGDSGDWDFDFDVKALPPAAARTSEGSRPRDLGLTTFISLTRRSNKQSSQGEETSVPRTTPTPEQVISVTSQSTELLGGAGKEPTEEPSTRAAK